MDKSSLVKKIMPFKKTYEKLLGKYEYYFKPKYKSMYGGAFNGQEIRKEIYSGLLASFNFNYLVETGAFRASTTLFLAESTLPVYTVEINDRFYSYAETRTEKISNIHLHQMTVGCFCMNSLQIKIYCMKMFFSI